MERKIKTLVHLQLCRRKSIGISRTNSNNDNRINTKPSRFNKMRQKTHNKIILDRREIEVGLKSPIFTKKQLCREMKEIGLKNKRNFN